MPDLTRDQFLQALEGGTPVQEPGPGTDLGILPLTGQALKDAASAQFDAAHTKMRSVAPSSAADQDIATKLGARAGIPFDTDSGVPFMVRTRMESRRNPEDQERFLKEFYGDANVRKNSYGDFVVSVFDGGKQKDMLANPLGVGMNDIGAVVAQAPEIAGGIIGVVLSRGRSINPGIWQAVKTLVGSSVGSEAAGLGKDLAVSDRPAADLTRERTGMTALDLAIGGSLGLFTKVATKLTTPFNNVGTLQFDARRAQQFFKEEYGLDLPLTPGESTGSTFLQRTESMALQKPGASTPLRQLIEERNAKLRDLQTIMLGTDVPTEEVVGQNAIATIGGKTAPARFEVERAAAALRKTGESELQAGIDTAVGSSGPVSRSALGANIRESAFAKREAFEAESAANYGKVHADPRTQQKLISGDVLSQDAEDLLKRLPAKERTVETIDVDAYGSPIARTSTGEEVIREFVPDGVLSKLNALKGLKGSSFRLDELMQMRREIDNDIAVGEAVKGVQTRYLTQMRNAVTKRIQTGLEEIDPKLLADWQAANDTYAKGVKQFKRAGIAELFRDPEQLSVLGDDEIVSRATSGRKAQDIYTAYKEFFGPTSPQIQGFRRAIADDVLSKSPLSDVVDAAGFVRRLDELAKDAPEVVKEVFGTNAGTLRDIAQALKGVEGSLSEREILEAMRSKTLTASKLKELIFAQSQRDQLYKNSLIKAVEDGTLKAERIKPTEFVDKFAFKAEPAEVKEVLALLDDAPQVTDDIRRLTFQKILDQATVRTATGDTTLDVAKLDALLSDRTMVERLQAVLGNATFVTLDNLSKFLRVGAAREGAFASAGALSAGTQIAGLVERGEFKYLDRALKNFVLATVYASPTLRKYFSNTLVSAQGSANAVNLAIASEPFLEAVIGTYGSEKGSQMSHAIKQSVDRFVQENPKSAAVQAQGQPPAPADITKEQFQQLLEQP
jgi:hypothetical protein